MRRAHPDLIVAGEDANEHDLSRAASATKARVYTAAGDSIRQVERAITQLGLLTGAPVKARTLVGRIEARRHQVADRLARVADVSVFVDVGFLNTIPDQSLIGDVLREAHGTNVIQTGEAGPVDIPDLLRLDPQVYLATSDAEVTLMDLRAGKLKQAARGQERPLRDRQRRPARARPADRRRAPAGRAPAPPGCVSLSSTPSLSTATAPSSASVDPVPLFQAQLRERGVGLRRRRDQGRRSQPRSPTTGRTRCSGATRRPSPPCGSSARASSSRAPVSTSTLRRSSTDSWRRS